MAIIKKIYFLFIVTCFTLIINSVAAQTPLEQLNREVDKILKYELSWPNKSQSKGLVIGIIDRDSSWIISRGTLPNGDTHFDSNAIFELSGFSKVIFSTYLEELIESSDMWWNDSLGKYLNDVQQRDDLVNITLRNLQMHQSGISKLISKTPDSAYKAYANLTYSDLIDAIKNVELQDNKRFIYNHHNYALLQAAIESKYQQSLPILINNWLVVEKKLNSIPLDPSLLTPGESRIQISSQPKRYKIYWGSLGMYVDMKWMIQFMKEIVIPLHYKKIENNSTHLIDTHINMRTKFIDGWYGLKLEKNRYIYSHAGSNKRHRVSIQMVPETQTAVIIMSNNENGVQGLSNHILRMLNKNWKLKSKING